MNDDDLVPEDPAAAAFTRLEGEVALVRRAVQQLAAEKSEIRIPDYSLTLGELSASAESAGQTLVEILAKPAMEMTPEDMARRIDRAVQQARESAAGEMQRTQVRFDNAAHELRGMISTLRAAHEQRLHLIWAASGGILAGCLLWSILPGASGALPATRANGSAYRRRTQPVGRRHTALADGQPRSVSGDFCRSDDAPR